MDALAPLAREMRLDGARLDAIGERLEQVECRVGDVEARMMRVEEGQSRLEEVTGAHQAELGDLRREQEALQRALRAKWLRVGAWAAGSLLALCALFILGLLLARV